MKLSKIKLPHIGLVNRIRIYAGIGIVGVLAISGAAAYAEQDIHPYVNSPEHYVVIDDTTNTAVPLERKSVDVLLNGLQPGDTYTVKVDDHNDRPFLEDDFIVDEQGAFGFALSLPLGSYDVSLSKDGASQGTQIDYTHFQNNGSIVLKGKYSYPYIEWEVSNM